MDHLTEFRNEVKRYIEAAKIKPTRFGKDAASDPTFVFELLNKKREPRLSTIDKIRRFMREHPPERSGA